jgi:hypothetical protein
VLGVDGIADFNALHSRRHDEQVQLYAFDILALDGEDLRSLPLSMRKTSLARLLARRPAGIFLATFEQGEIGPDLFKAACDMGLEGMVSKRADRPHFGPEADIRHCTKFGEDSVPSSVQTSSVDDQVTAGRTLRATNPMRRVHLEF